MICDTLETRQLITLDADGILVRGNPHDGDAQNDWIPWFG